MCQPEGFGSSSIGSSLELWRNIGVSWLEWKSRRVNIVCCLCRYIYRRYTRIYHTLITRTNDVFLSTIRGNTVIGRYTITAGCIVSLSVKWCACWTSFEIVFVYIIYKSAINHHVLSYLRCLFKYIILLVNNYKNTYTY